MGRIDLLLHSALTVLIIAGVVSQGCANSKSEDTSSGTDSGGSDNAGGGGSGGAAAGTGGRSSGGTAGAMSGGSGGSGGSGENGGMDASGGSGGGGGGGGSGAAGGAFECDEAVCVRGQSYCRYYTPGTGGMPSYSCNPFPASCTERTDCSCFCTPNQAGSCQGLVNGLFCMCTHSDGAVRLSCGGA